MQISDPKPEPDHYQIVILSWLWFEFQVSELVYIFRHSELALEFQHSELEAHCII